MKKIIILFVVSLFTVASCFAQQWTTEQLNTANTAKTIDYISQAEKETILYINLARLYPKQFAKNEVENYNGVVGYNDYGKNKKYRQSLLKTLYSLKPSPLLNFNDKLYNYANCFAKESGSNGTMGHKRIHCSNMSGLFGECCSYGMEKGKDIAMQWLIDNNVSDVGHRIICLGSEFTQIAISIANHKVWNKCAVADFGGN